MDKLLILEQASEEPTFQPYGAHGMFDPFAGFRGLHYASGVSFELSGITGQLSDIKTPI